MTDDEKLARLIQMVDRMQIELDALGCIASRAKIHRSLHKSDRLLLVAKAEQFQDVREPLLRVGDRVRLNSGSPPLLVVDAEERCVTVAWSRGKSESVLPRSCVHRLCD